MATADEIRADILAHAAPITPASAEHPDHSRVHAMAVMKMREVALLQLKARLEAVEAGQPDPLTLMLKPPTP